METAVAARRVRERAVDLVLVGCALAGWWFYGVTTASGYPAIPDWYWPVDRTLGLVACGALWWARRRPVVVALVVLVPGAVAMTTAVAVVLAVYMLGARARPRVSVGITALYLASALPYHAVLPVPGVDWVSWSVMIVLVHVLALTVGLLTRSRRLVLEGLRAEAVRQRDLSVARLEGVRRAERERIAREMHDVLAHRVSLVSVHAGALEYRLAAAAGRGGGSPPSAEEVGDAVAVIRRNAHLAVEELRQVLAVLQADDPDAMVPARPQPRLSDLPALVDEARAGGQHVTARLRLDDLREVPAAFQRTVYRVVQEGLTNARKHAPGARVTVDVAPHGQDGFRVLVANPVPVGVTAAEIPGAGAGLTGLAERVALDGGSVTYGVHDGDFRVVVTVPAGRA